MRWQLKTPGRLFIVGPSQSGKSTLALKLISDDSVWDSPFSKVIYNSPTQEDRQEYLSELQEKAAGKDLWLVKEKIPTFEEINTFSEGLPVLLIIDDLLAFPNVGKKIDNLSILHSHHRGITCVFLVQDNFAKILKTASRNATTKILMYQTGDWRHYLNLNTHLFPERKGFIQDCISYAKWKLSFPYIVINTHPLNGPMDVPRRNMVYTGIFRDERHLTSTGESSPYFFDLEAQ